MWKLHNFRGRYFKFQLSIAFASVILQIPSSLLGCCMGNRLASLEGIDPPGVPGLAFWIKLLLMSLMPSYRFWMPSMVLSNSAGHENIMTRERRKRETAYHRSSRSNFCKYDVIEEVLVSFHRV